jgi:tetratricopeptide (TPR) repeat protein
MRREILETRREVFGEEHPSTIGAYGALAWVHEMMDDPETAMKLRTQAKEIRRRLTVRENTEAHDKNRYASSLVWAKRELQNPKDAIQFATQANEMTDYANRDYVSTLAEAYFRAGQTRKAIEVQEKAIGLVPEDDTNARNNLESRLAEFHASTGDQETKRRLKIEEIARLKEAAEQPDASPRAKDSYAWALLTANPLDLRNPGEAQRVALEVNEQTGYEDSELLKTLALAYHLSGDAKKAIETEEQALTHVPEDDQWARPRNERLLLIFKEEGRKDFDLAETLTGTWLGTLGPIESRVEFRREGDYIYGRTLNELPWVPEGEDWLRFEPGTGKLNFAVADAGWTNVRFEPGDFMRMDSGDLVVWHLNLWFPVRFSRE